MRATTFSPERLASALRLVLVTEGRGDVAAIERRAVEALEAGVRAVHVREPELAARQLAAICARLRELLEPHGGLVIVGDRADVAASGAAHAVQLGHGSLDPASVRRFVGGDVLIGCSTHGPEQIRDAVAGGADYLTLAPVFPTASKPGHPGLGVEAARALTLDCPVPTVWLGGMDPARVAELRGGPAAGFAAIGAFARAGGAAAMVEAAGLVGERME